MDDVSFADVAQQSVSFSKDDPSERMILDLIDTPWIQRLRDIDQTANVKLLYMFSEHSRFGHSLGVAHLACQVMRRLARDYYSDIEPYKAAVGIAALLHDIGHLAPGSHIAQFSWFPNDIDRHEETAGRIIKSSPEIINKIKVPQVLDTVLAILAEDPALPPWTWEIISGGGWNVDRGNWCIIDSVMAGVSYGKYNIPALTDAIILTKDKHLALRESRLDAMLHFAISRQAMYRQIYQHRVVLASEKLTTTVIKRARDLVNTSNSQAVFMDEVMQHALTATSLNDLSLDDIFKMRESWFKYHLMRWTTSSDLILKDLAERVLNRRLFKTVRITPSDNPDELFKRASNILEQCNLNPDYYLFKVSTKDFNRGDALQSMLVKMDNDEVISLSEADPLYDTMLHGSSVRSWLVMPAEAKQLLGRSR